MDLDDLNEVLFRDMTLDNQIEHLREIRLSRRQAVRKPSKKTEQKIKNEQIANTITPEQALEMLKLLGGN